MTEDTPKVINTPIGTVVLQLDPESSGIINSALYNTVMIPEDTAEKIYNQLRELLDKE